jgi:formate-dependent nitrite reductase cytochrome c552 subunit
MVTVTLSTLAVMAALNMTAGTQAQEKERKKPPPLSLDGLLDEELPEASTATKTNSKNDSCYVCHANYTEEELVVVHGEGDVSCIDCHGKSEDHRNDEDNVTPPDKMYALDGVDSMCGKCHDTHDAAALAVLQRWQERCPQKTDAKTIVCTDCHFQHRLAFRTVWWDKKTGKLIVRKDGERVKKAGQ